MSVLEKAIGMLAPVDCIGCGVEGHTLCAACALSEIIPFGERCYNCNKLSSAGRTCPSCQPSSPRHVWISSEYANIAKVLVQKLKFSHQRTAARPIAHLMKETLSSFMSQKQVTQVNYLAMPIPTATSRVRQRSFDHTLHIARYLGFETTTTLKRLGQSRQVGAKRDVRTKQAAGNYYLLNPSTVKGRNVLLVDDVVTTGATLRAATAVLRKAGAKRVDALVFAKRI